MICYVSHDTRNLKLHDVHQTTLYASLPGRAVLSLAGNASTMSVGAPSLCQNGDASI